MITVALLGLVFIWALVALRRRKNARVWARGRPARRPDSPPTILRRPKPPWVPREVLRLKALIPQHGCRTIAAVFNQMQARRGMMVGKSYVAALIRRHPLEIEGLRRELRRRPPKPVPKNLIWATDLTFEAPSAGSSGQALFGLLDHGTRACLALRRLRTRTSLDLIRVILDAVERYGCPKSLRTDNEPIFTSALFRSTLRLLGIRHQRIVPGAPWQNGRIERFFGTLKRALRERGPSPAATGTPQGDLDLFRFWYNHARPHKDCCGRTPAMAWANVETPKRKPRFVHFWEGCLRGYFVPL